MIAICKSEYIIPLVSYIEKKGLTIKEKTFVRLNIPYASFDKT